MKLLNIGIVILLFVQCQSIKNNSDVNDIQEIAKGYFGEGVVVEFNDNKSFALFSLTNKKDNKMPVNALSFGIYNVDKQELVYKEQKNDAKVKWVDNENLEVRARPGVSSVDQSVNDRMKHYYINVRTLQTTTKPN
ncbi:hypothetical protein [Carboxylicivirga sp. M1479]|uniref:hypothetical protein n=1 Tax=Carboxylicivirga sp. M1479 TaxID=2594476 RepID=UPI0011784530|nr:hypothetical protein [Carboxylicivirga sp. M1479]TRX71127.1 hypothetical protein FNN09_07860 [Carboxylicivirga sp. M1479]